MIMTMGTLNKTAILHRMIEIGCVEGRDYRFTGNKNEFEFFDVCDEADCVDYDPDYGDIMW
jgi:hypothetical protein